MGITAVGRQRVVLLAVSIVAAMAVSGCQGGSDRVLPQPDPTQDVRVGATYRFVMGTHCGVKFINVDGSNWMATRLLDGSPPSGWAPGGNHGRLKIESSNTAVFRDSHGHRVTFKRQPGNNLSFCM